MKSRVCENRSCVLQKKINRRVCQKNLLLLFFIRYDIETNEVKATLKSNITQEDSPMLLYGEFINQTDPTTLNRHVGTKLRFTYQKMFVQHDLFYKNTYEYWALGSKLEYAKGK